MLFYGTLGHVRGSFLKHDSVVQRRIHALNNLIRFCFVFLRESEIFVLITSNKLQILKFAVNKCMIKNKNISIKSCPVMSI